MEKEKNTKKVAEKKPATKKTAPAKKAAAPKKAVEKKETVKKVAAKKIEAKKEEIKEEVKPIEEKPVVLEQKVVEEPVKEVEKKKIPFLTIILAITTIVLAVVLCIKSSTKSTIELNTMFPDVFGEETASLKLPSGYLFSDNYEFFKSEDGVLTTKGMVTAATYSEEEYAELKETFVSYYGAEEVENENYEVMKISQADETSTYDYYFFYKDTKFVQLVLIDCTEAETNTVINSINF